MNKLTPEKIKTRRNELGLTQAQLANRIGISVTCIYEWERGTRAPHKLRLPIVYTALELQDNGEPIA